MIKSFRQHRTLPSFDEVMKNEQVKPLPSFDEVMGTDKKKVGSQDLSTSSNTQANTNLSLGGNQNQKISIEDASKLIGGNQKQIDNQFRTTFNKPKKQIVSSKPLSNSEVEQEATNRLKDNLPFLFNGNDPIGNINNAIQTSKDQLRQGTISSQVDITQNENEGKIHDKMLEIANQNPFGDTKTASDFLYKQLKKVTGKDIPINSVNISDIENTLPKNQSTQAAIQKVANNRFITATMNDSKDFKDFIDKYENASNKFLHVDKNDEQQKAQAYQQILNDPDVIEAAKDNPKMWNGYLQERHDFNNRFPTIAYRDIAHRIAQYAQDEGKNGIVYTNRSKKGWDDIVEEMYKNKKIDATDRALYYQKIDKGDLPTGDVVDMAWEGYKKATNDIGTTIKLDKLGLAVPSEKFTEITPTGNKVLGGGAGFVGYIAPMLVGGAELKALGATPQAANLIMGMAQFGGSAERQSKKYFPDNPANQLGYTLLNVAFNTIALDIPIEGAQKSISALLGKEAQNIIPKLTSNTISEAGKEQIKQSFIKKAATVFGKYGIDILSNTSKTAGSLTTLGVLNRALNLSAGDKHAFDNMDLPQEFADYFKTALPLGVFGATANALAKKSPEINKSSELLPQEQTAISALIEKDPQQISLKPSIDVLKDNNATPEQKKQALKEVYDQLTHPENEAQVGQYLGKAADAVYELPYQNETKNARVTNTTTPTTEQNGAEVRNTENEQAGVNTTDNGLQDGNGGGGKDVGGKGVEDNYVSKFPKPDKPITDLSSDELYDYANKVKDYNKNIEKEFFGEEGAKKYREAYRTWNNMYADPKEQEAAGKIVKEMEASLTPSQEKEFFGIGAPDNGMYDHKEIADVARKVSLIEGAENVNDIARSLKLPLLDFSKNTDNPPIESVIVLNAAKKKAEQLGIDPKELIKKSLENIANDLPDKEDAAFLAKTILDKLIQPTTDESKQIPNTISTGKEDVGGEKVEVVKNEETTATRNDKNHTTYDINSGDKKVGSIAVNYREDLGGYQVESSKVDAPRFGIGTEAYKKLISQLDKPLISDSSLTDAAKGVWRKLENEGFAKYDEKLRKYISLKPTNEIPISTEEKSNTIKEANTVEQGAGEEEGKPSTKVPEGNGTWRQKFNETDDIATKNQILDFISDDNKSTEAELRDAYNAAKETETVTNRINWNLANNKNTPKDVFDEIIQSGELEKTASDDAIKHLIEKRKQNFPDEQQPIPISNEGQPPSKEPPVEPPKESEGGKGSIKDKGVLNHLVESKNISEETKKGLEDKGLKYTPISQKERSDLAKSVVDEMGIDDAVLHAEAHKFDDGVNSAVFGESLNRLYEQELNAKTPQEKLDAAKKFADISDRYDQWARKGGREISQINDFYKKSPLGITLSENKKRAEDFKDWSKQKEKSWKEAFDEWMKEPEFEKIVKEKVGEDVKQERASERSERKERVHKAIDDTMAKWAKKLKAKGTDDIQKQGIGVDEIFKVAGATMKKAYDAGEAVVKIVNDAIEYISKQLGHEDWGKEEFRKEWEQRLVDKKAGKKPFTDEELKTKVLDKFRKKLKGLTDKQKEDVVRKAFKQLVENGALEYDDFKKIIADVTGRGEMSVDEAKRLKELVAKTNEVEQAAKELQEKRTDEAFVKYRAAMLETAKATKELNEMLWNKPNIMRRLTSIMQLNTLGIPSLINNPIYNIWNQMLVRFPVGVVNDAIDRGLAAAAKLVGKSYEREYNVWETQASFFKGLSIGTKESLEQFFTGLNRQDLFQKEIYGQQIRPFRSMRDLIAWKMGKKNLSSKQVVDKSLQATVGIPAEVVARVLNIGDKPQRFAAESAQGAAFAKILGLKGVDYKIFMEFPREEAYRAYRAKGLSDADAAKKADYVKAAIEKEGQRSTFQQDNLLNDLINKMVGGEKSGIGQFAKALTISPFIKIPSNAFWSAYNLINPEIALLQSMWHGGKAYKLRGDSTASSMQLREARYWFAHAVVGIALRSVIIPIVANGIFNAQNTQDNTKKEREGEQNFEQQGAINLTKLLVYLRGGDPSKVKGGLTLRNSWMGQFGVIGNTIARKYDEMTPEQKDKQRDFWDYSFGGLEKEGLQEAQNGIFSNTSALLTAIDGKGSFGFDQYFRNTFGMMQNTFHPAMFSQIERQSLDYVPQYKGDSFVKELKNDVLMNSLPIRKLTGAYPPAKISIWGEPLKRPDNTLMRLFGISRTNEGNFAYPIYEDAKKTGDIGFFPPAVSPNLYGQKLNLQQQNVLQTYVGQARKSLIAPYVNDGAYIEGFEKKYSEIKDVEVKKMVLGYLYETGRIQGVKKFLDENPQFKKTDPTTYEEEINDNYDEFKAAVKERQPTE